MLLGNRGHVVIVGLSLLFGASGCQGVVIVDGGQGEGMDQAPSLGEPGTPDAPDAPSTSPRRGTVLQDCPTDQGYFLSTHLAPKEGSPALRVIGVYESRSDHSADYHPTGSATVDVEWPGPTVLVLSSYEPTAWAVKTGPDTTIERVILNGFYPQLVTAPPGAVVDDHSGDGKYFSPCGFEWPNDDGGCDTPALVAGAEQLSGLTLSSFHGCYRMTNFAYVP
jgi:hypothetical protein